MLLNETGFTFGGVHSRRDMGLLYVEKEGHIAIPEIKRNSYQIAGMSGTLLLSGETWQPFNLEGSLYPAEEPRTQAEAQALLRDISAWLTAGRQQLIFDYEPDIFYMAELSATSKWTLRNWFGGELQIRFLVQPYAYNVEEHSATVTATTGTTSVQLPLAVQTGLPAPLKLTIENNGSAAITGVSCRDITLQDMRLTRGQKLEITSEPPAGATIGSSSALQYATAFAPVYLDNGVNTLRVSLTSEAGGTHSAVITASARGRW
ncbi:MAG: hypothetical protein IJ124_05250 [Clostridia bacterium]|nr:hypothetical protein [Clostridia bacterium]MBQ8708088.1 hypothetical protein [Succinivibrionaceae bacterium]MBQ8708134.1 hypothetical protein [Succinivibrionaceae bacterium]